MYRITGFEFLVSFDTVHFDRQAYDILGWLGDVGGIMQGLSWIGGLVIGSYYAP